MDKIGRNILDVTTPGLHYAEVKVGCRPDLLDDGKGEPREQVLFVIYSTRRLGRCVARRTES